jgi:hypothetical protein
MKRDQGVSSERGQGKRGEHADVYLAAALGLFVPVRAYRVGGGAQNELLDRLKRFLQFYLSALEGARNRQFFSCF